MTDPGSGSGAIKPATSPRVIWISALGTIFEWYDFFLYGAVATLLSRHFFPAGNSVASLLLVLATFGAGFAVRPIGAVVFGSLGDRIGRKYTFVFTMLLMGLATAAIGILPTYQDAGLTATVLLVVCRLVQGLALGGEYGGAAIYVAEHAPPGRRGLHTSWIQLSAAIGFLLALSVTGAVHYLCGDVAWNAWGWRIPFLASLLMLSVSVYGRLRLQESPIFSAMKQRGEASRSPVRDSLLSRENLPRILVALFGVAAGQTVIWFTAQYSTLYLLQSQGGLDEGSASALMALATLIAAPVFVLSGWLSDHIGRRRVLLTAYASTLLLVLPLFVLMGNVANSQRADAARNSPIVVSGPDCKYQVFDRLHANGCAQVLEFLSNHRITYSIASPATAEVLVRVGEERIEHVDLKRLEAVLDRTGYLAAAQLTPARGALIVGIAALLITLAAMAYGPNAAILVELFPARIRYTSLSIPYHIGTGYFGGFQPFVTQYIAAKTANPYAGLAYPLTVVAVALVVCIFLLKETKDRDIRA